MFVEAIGIIATVIILIGFLFKNPKYIRTINIFGCIVFVIYGVLINSVSVWLVNGALVFVHIYHLLKKERG